MFQEYFLNPSWLTNNFQARSFINNSFVLINYSFHSGKTSFSPIFRFHVEPLSLAYVCPGREFHTNITMLTLATNWSQKLLNHSMEPSDLKLWSTTDPIFDRLSFDHRSMGELFDPRLALFSFLIRLYLENLMCCEWWCLEIAIKLS